MNAYKIFPNLLSYFCLFCLPTSAQLMVDSTKPTVSNYTLAKQYYKKAGAYRTVGYVFAGAAVVTGVSAAVRTSVEIVFLPVSVLTDDVGFTKAEKWLAAFAICTAASIAFFVAAGKQTRKARLLPYTSAGVRFTPNMVLLGTAEAGVTVVIPLGK